MTTKRRPEKSTAALKAEIRRLRRKVKELTAELVNERRKGYWREYVKDSGFAPYMTIPLVRSLKPTKAKRRKAA